MFVLFGRGFLVHTTIQTNGDDPLTKFLVTTNPQQNIMVTIELKKW